MADLTPQEVANQTPQDAKKIQVTQENAPLLTVHYLSLIYGRLGYIIKLLEKK